LILGIGIVEDISCEGGFVHSDLRELSFIKGQMNERGNLGIMEGQILSKSKQLIDTFVEEV